ncbi:MAG: EAL domain-containing protein [Paludibacterium sp.]|uniref:putative bifunctional diguanylate cyclase/phosphodiesterase n=1 Tax=Paludibacterium sp. TaxID=1917523 RepID=UPI0025CCFA83|nr:EAL domain-containing protein [Paludibacterium sp.]MBV8048200.1 EAL domain-containing protein [Paludibacterium sp.]MBV8646962.1 EAL domain-containing protein [Paludibacterium sp.]
MLNSMRIGMRLALAFALMLALLVAVAALSLSRLNRLSTVTQSLVDVQVQKQYLAHQANQHALTAANQLLVLLQTSDRTRRIGLYQQMDGELDAADLAITRLDKALAEAPTPSTSSEKAQLSRLKALRRAYNDRFYQTVNLIEQEGPEKARQQFEGSTRQALAALLDGTRVLSDTQQQLMRDELWQLRQAEHQARMLVVSLSAGALFLGVLLAWRMAKSITRPVSEAVGVAEAIARGDLGRPVPVGGRDEIGKLLGALRVMRDAISSREARILRLAYEDDLTGLPNRTRLVEVFQALPADTRGAVLVFDINRFSLINLALGQQVGDRLLREIGLRLSPLLEEGQWLVRLWADQFALLLPGADLPAAQSLGEQMALLLRAPLMLDQQRLDVEGTLGIALFPQDGQDAPTLLRRAELAARTAKARRRQWLSFAESGAEPAHAELSLMGEMREALARGEFVLFYQPKVDLRAGGVPSAEALLRWQHPERGLVPPGRFIPFAEQTGFIREITPWLLDQVMAHAAAWRRTGRTTVPSVNLSAHDLLNPGLADLVAGLLRRYGLAPDALCLEITESALMEDPAQALALLDRLAGLGVKLSIDDYGSGQASLGYLKTLPVHELKIDRVFVDGVDRTPKNAAIVRSTILLCHELGLSVVAEGAETEAELAWLGDNGCDLVQGYVLARPMALEQFLAWQPPAV